MSLNVKDALNALYATSNTIFFFYVTSKKLDDAVLHECWMKLKEGTL